MLVISNILFMVVYYLLESVDSGVAVNTAVSKPWSDPSSIVVAERSLIHQG